MTECIHGFEDGLCDICFPRPVPVKEAPPKATSRSTGTRSTSRARRGAAIAEPTPRHTVPLGTRRIYHVTHLDNLPSILEAGAIQAGATPAVDLLSPEARAERAEVEVVPGETLPAYVPFALSPHATWWNDVRSGAQHSSWSDAARTNPATRYVTLVGTVAPIGDDVVVCDSDVSGRVPLFGVGPVAGSSLLQRQSVQDPELLEPEVLAPGSYSIDDVVLLAVPNEPIRDRVRAMLKAAGGHAPKVVVYPPWFQPTEFAD